MPCIGSVLWTAVLGARRMSACSSEALGVAQGRRLKGLRGAASPPPCILIHVHDSFLPDLLLEDSFSKVRISASQRWGFKPQRPSCSLVFLAWARIFATDLLTRLAGVHSRYATLSSPCIATRGVPVARPPHIHIVHTVNILV